jgi:hypothetical protein
MNHMVVNRTDIGRQSLNTNIESVDRATYARLTAWADAQRSLQKSAAYLLELCADRLGNDDVFTPAMQKKVFDVFGESHGRKLKAAGKPRKAINIRLSQLPLSSHEKLAAWADRQVTISQSVIYLLSLCIKALGCGDVYAFDTQKEIFRLFADVGANNADVDEEVVAAVVEVRESEPEPPQPVGKLKQMSSLFAN